MNINNQKGFSILAVILVIVAVVVAIGVWALSGQTNTSNSADSKVDIAISAMIADTSAIKLGFDKLVIDGANPTSIVFRPNTASTPAAPNILDPLTGIQYPSISSAIINSNPGVSDGFIIFAPNLQGDNVGTTASDPAIIINGVTDVACRKIQVSLTGSGYLQGVGWGGPATFPDASKTNPTTNSGIALGTSGTFPNVTMGCFSTPGGDHNIFFRILKPM